MEFELLKSEVPFSGKVFDVKVDTIKPVKASETKREVAVHPGGAVIVAVTPEQKVVTVKQFRYPLEEKIYEMPAGKLDKDEDPELCAVRELKEETGYSAGDVVKLGKYATTPGFCSEILHVFLARNLKPGDHDREEGEMDMEVFELSFDTLEEMIIRGELKDAKSIAALYMAKLYITGKVDYA